MEIYMFEVKHYENLTHSEFKGLFACIDGLELAVDKSRNLEYCNLFIDNTKRI